jgi:hypothetical protein
MLFDERPKGLFGDDRFLRHRLVQTAQIPSIQGLVKAR